MKEDVIERDINSTRTVAMSMLEAVVAAFHHLRVKKRVRNRLQLIDVLLEGLLSPEYTRTGRDTFSR